MIVLAKINKLHRYVPMIFTISTWLTALYAMWEIWQCCITHVGKCEVNTTYDSESNLHLVVRSKTTKNTPDEIPVGSNV